MPDSSFEAQQKQLVGPREVPWQSSESAGRPLRVLRGAENVPDIAASEAFEAFKGPWKSTKQAPGHAAHLR